MALTAEDTTTIREIFEDIIDRRVNPRFDRVDARFDRIEGRLERVEDRLGAVELNLKAVQADIKVLQADMRGVSGLVAEHSLKLSRLEHA